MFPSSVIVVSTSLAKVPSDTPLDWTLVNVFEDLDFRLCLSVSRHEYDVYKHPDQSETSLVCPKRVSFVETSLVWTRLVLDRARLIDNIDNIDNIDKVDSIDSI